MKNNVVAQLKNLVNLVWLNTSYSVNVAWSISAHRTYF